MVKGPIVGNLFQLRCHACAHRVATTRADTILFGFGVSGDYLGEQLGILVVG